MSLVNKSKSLIKLYRLISTLTAAEKNVFRRHIRNYSEWNNQDAQYIKLFDCVNDACVETGREIKGNAVKLPKKSSLKPDTGKEKLAAEQIFFEKFKSRFHSRAFCSPGETGPMANYLFDKILESLRSNNPTRSIRRELHAMILDINFLFHKELYDDCLQQTRAAQKLAVDIEAIPIMLDLLRMERRILANTRKWQSLAQMRTIFEEEQRWLKQLNAATAMYDLHIETVIAEYTKKRIDDDEVLKGKVNQQLDYFQDNKIPEDAGFELKVYRNAIAATLIGMAPTSPFLDFLKNRKQADIVQYLKQIVDLHEDYPQFKSEDALRYLIFVINYLGFAFGAGIKTEMEKYAHLMDGIDQADPEFLRHVVYIRLFGFIIAKDFSGAQNYLNTNKIWDLMQLNGPYIPVSRRQVLCYTAGTVFFVREDFTQACNWFTASMEDKVNAANAKVQLASAFFNLIAEYEIGRAMQQPSKRSVRRALTQHIGEGKIAEDSFEAFLVDSYYRILKLEKNKQALRNLATELLSETKIRLETRQDLNHFNLYLAWLESKEQDRPLRFTLDKYI